MENYRKIKISRKYQKSTWNEKSVPALIMQGEYMRAAGFSIGTECSVKIEQGRITILAL